MEIKQLSDSDISVWNDYLSNHPFSTFYHKAEWKMIMEREFGHRTYYIMAMDRTEVVGVLPLVHIKSMVFGSIFCSMPFLNLGGVIANNHVIERVLLEEAIKILEYQRGDYLELRQYRKSSADLPYKAHKISMTIELANNPDDLWNKFKSKHRRDIRRAAKNDLSFRMGGRELLNDFYSTMQQGWKQLGTPLYRKKFFEILLDELGGHIDIFVVYHKREPVATALNGLFKDTVEGLWAATAGQAARLMANYVLYWEMIRVYCLRNYKYFHLGRSSKDSGGHAFKVKWNASPKQLYWEYALCRSKAVPELNVQNPRYSQAIRMWRALPLFVTHFLGPFIARSIP